MLPKAPPLTGTWLNCADVEWRSWRGNVGVVVFWSIGCEASLAVLNHLQQLKAERFGELCILAVHSPRTADELDESFVRTAIDRHCLSMPVVHDATQDNWARYNPPGWPSAIVINRKQRAVGLVQGAGDLSVLDDAIAAEFARSQRGELPMLPAANTPNRAESIIAWPAGVATLSPTQIVVSDVGNCRIAVLELDGDQSDNGRSAKLVGVISTTSAPGPVVAIDQITIAVSLPNEGRVVAFKLPIFDGQPTATKELATGLVRPQGLALDTDGSLLIADAGSDQLIRVTTQGEQGKVAGTGFTGCADGKASQSTLAQPVGVARTDAGVAFVDTATSTLRLLTDDGRVLTATKRSADLPGLVDGPLHRASLLRPRATVALNENRLLIVDTGNSRLRIVANRALSTLGLGGLLRPEAACLLEDGRVIVADTGNNRLVVVDLELQSATPLVIEAPTELSNPFDITAAAGSSLAVEFASPTTGPWHVTVTAEPASLLAGPFSIVRREPGSVALALGAAGEGTVTVHSRALNDSDIVRSETHTLWVR